eukprot:GHVU01018523.1.p1 GENE.GHVU01018523.1~~GHVU01018523.1.p1  ORF type:complete len:208 (+),score=23.79 GHVU01018523.1:182-805(+)
MTVLWHLVSILASTAVSFTPPHEPFVPIGLPYSVGDPFRRSYETHRIFPKHPLGSKKASGQATSKDGKRTSLRRLRRLVQESDYFFSFSASKAKKNDIDELKKKMPEGVHICMVKNSLLRLAVTRTKFDVCKSALKASSYFVFASSDQIQNSTKSFVTFAKKNSDFRKNNVPRLGVLDGRVFVGKELTSLATIAPRMVGYDFDDAHL